MEQDRIADLEVLLGYSFRDKNLLLNALSHSSIKTDNRPSNERLEFLGDAVLGLVLSDALYRRFPHEDEGVLTRIKSHAVSRSTLQRIAAAMALDRFILVGKGVRRREIPASLLGNLFEALVGAIYLDTGLEAARKFIERHIDVVVSEIVEDRAERNYKSMLQQYCQRERNTVPVYKVLREGGPAHSRVFEVVTRIHSKEWGRARAASKKEAEQGAARAALIHLKVITEKERETVRGAGSVLPTPGLEPKRKSRRRSKAKKKAKTQGSEKRSRASGAESGPADAAAKKKPRRRRKKTAPRQAEPPPEAPADPRPKPSGRRRRRGGRGRRKTKTEAEGGGD